DLDRRAPLRGDDDLAELIDRFEPAGRPQRDLGVPLIDAAAGDLDVVPLDRVADLADAESMRRQLLQIELDVDLTRAPAADRHVADAVHSLQRAADLL